MSKDVHPVDEFLPVPKLLTLGVQHVLVMYAGAVAVPLILPDGSRILAINCGGPSFLFHRERLIADLGPRLVKLVHNTEAALMNVEQRPDQRSTKTPRS